MILAIECVVACILFTVIMVGGVLWNREAFLHEYAPAVQERFLEKNPNYVQKEKKEATVSLVIAKILMSMFFIALLTFLTYLAGAKTFLQGILYAYITWFVVNWYDVVALDIGIFAHWKKVRLPGTEDMDKEYTSNVSKHVKDGFFGTAIGVPIALICGWILSLLV